MLALYQAGRSSDALAAYGAARHRLADELGLEPSRQLRELEVRILSHDPALGTPPAGPRRVARRGRRRLLAAAIALAVVIPGIAAGVIVARGGSGASEAAKLVEL